MYEADLIFSCGENNYLPVVDVWIVIDVLRATTVMTRWFELGGGALYPVKTPDEARVLTYELTEQNLKPLLMGEVNGIPPEGFNLGNSPVDLNLGLIREHNCGVMSTTNGTVALLEAASSGSPVIAASLRNYAACLDYALTLGNNIGFLCSGRKKRPSWEDTLCAGAILKLLQSRGELLTTDSAKIAMLLWQNRGDNLEKFIMNSTHAQYLEKIGYLDDIAFSSQCNVSTVVPVLTIDKDSRNILRSVSGNSQPYDHKIDSQEIKPDPVKSPDPFEELLSYTKKPAQYFFIGRKEK
ncbi:MAG: 2-phosphosulfolactate phosphatase [Synergistaceae bacterium]|nr:2-phosphosulfolactate phosphatase [Synergistaceae bacterium]